MGSPLEIRRTAAEWAAAREAIEFKEKIGEFEQLQAIVAADLAILGPDETPADWRDAPVTGTLQFGYLDGTNVPGVDCRAFAELDAVCQRCLLPFRLTVEVESRLVLLEMDRAIDGYEEFEVWELEESSVRPRDIVEELLIMAMPYSAMHTESAACRALSSPGDGGEKMTRPFAALRERMAEED